jgi:N-acetylneuraminic acid mutarotase
LTVLRTGFLFAARLVLAATILLPAIPVSAQAAASARPLFLEERLAYQHAVEGVYWRHRTWPTENGQPKPSLDAVLPASEVQARVENALRLSTALAEIWQQPITGEQLQGEIDRQAANTRQPELLRELWAALGNDAYVIAETIARPALAERLARNAFERDSRFAGRSFDEWWQTSRSSFPAAIDEPDFAYTLAFIAPDAPSADSWAPTQALPEGSMHATTIWTGAEMIVWGGGNTLQNKFSSGARYNPATDTWRQVAGFDAPEARDQHTAVWTGTEMIVWGGCGLLDRHYCTINSGGRYNPTTDSWQRTTGLNAPGPRMGHTAVWTGSEMIIWGGCSMRNDACVIAPVGNGGGRYNPLTDTWTATKLTAPAGRVSHTAIWTGSEMIVWGGETDSGVTATGARYNPSTDTWTATKPVSPSMARLEHSAVWTGSNMIVWGGASAALFGTYFNDGAIYSPATNTWRKVSVTGAPAARYQHGAAWTGARMIVWGGARNSTFDTTGGVYNPRTNTWTAVSTVNAPPGKVDFGTVWTGSQMLVWGGQDPRGGRYSLTTNTWTPISEANAPSSRDGHTAVWTGAEMIVWGGVDITGNGGTNTGARYNLATDSWTALPVPNQLIGRRGHTAIWTGTQMIVWGGQSGTTAFKDGGRYNPQTNTWTYTDKNTAPAARSYHSAVWTGTEMIVYGGMGMTTTWLANGARYNPATNSWTALSTTGAPVGRYSHAAVWSGSKMIVWGGATSDFETNTGGQYDPVSNTWTATSTVTAPSSRSSAAAAWTGSKMVVWGGFSYRLGDTWFGDGAQYSPVTNTWTPISLINAPSARYQMSAVWTGTAMLIWGGGNDTGVATGDRYDPASDTWTSMITASAPGARTGQSTVWTGDRMIVWGGDAEDSGTYTRTGGVYDPGTL